MTKPSTCTVCSGGGYVSPRPGEFYSCPACASGDRIADKPLTAIWTQEQYLKFHEQFCERAWRLSKSKNDDYAGGDGSAFRNFESVEAIGITTTEQGFLVRMADKMSRLATFANRGTLSVQDESAEDTLLDLVNYSVLLAAFIRMKKGQDNA